MSDSPAVIWHDLECGSYHEDLALWEALAAGHGDPVLDIGAGTGRVALALARSGHSVIALDHDAELLGTLRRRARARHVEVETVLADARAFTLARRIPLCLVPMQTIQMLATSPDRLALLRCAHAALSPGGRLAIAIADALEPFEVVAGSPEPLPDVTEREGIVYSSRPLAVRAQEGGYVLERRRETVSAAGELCSELDRVRLAAVGAEELEAEGRRVGFAVARRGTIAQTAEYVGSTVVMLDA